MYIVFGEDKNDLYSSGVYILVTMTCQKESRVKHWVDVSVVI